MEDGASPTEPEAWAEAEAWTEEFFAWLQQRYAELPAPEKLMLNFSQFFLANRHARLFLFGYMVCLHLLVSGAMYAASHHC